MYIISRSVVLLVWLQTKKYFKHYYFIGHWTSTLRENIYISYKIWDQCPRIGIPCCIVLHFLCRNASKLVVIGYFGEGTKILYLSTIWPIRVQESCTSPHKTTLDFLTINMCLSTTFWSKVQKFCTHLQVNQSEYKKMYFTT